MGARRLHRLCFGGLATCRSANSNTTQWFHFAVWNAQPGETYKLNLVNFSKPKSLFGSGKRPLMCSCNRSADMQESAAAAAAGAGVVQDVQEQQAGVADGRSTGSADSKGEEASSKIGSSSTAGRLKCQGGLNCTGLQHFNKPSGDWLRTGHSISYYPSPTAGGRGTQQRVQPDLATAAATAAPAVVLLPAPAIQMLQ
jgi:hypothetical protein